MSCAISEGSGLRIVILCALDIEIMRSEDRCSTMHLFVWSTRANDSKIVIQLPVILGTTPN